MKLKAVYETEAYVSEYGYYVIKQTDQYHVEPSVIMLSPAQLKELIADMTAHYVNSDWWGAENED
jgi:hypothetical protein